MTLTAEHMSLPGWKGGFWRQDPDPFTLEIVKQRLVVIAEEMFLAQGRSSKSPIIYEVLDMGTGITDRNGEMAGSGAGIPAFVGVLDKTVKKVIEKSGNQKIGMLLADFSSLGQVRVTEVRPAISYARQVQGGGFKRGHRLVRANPQD